MPGADVAVLCSGGLDSAVLVAAESQRRRVQPVYVSAGLSWETAELALLDRLLAALDREGRVEPLARLRVDVADLYPAAHWALNAKPPAYDTPDEDVYLPGRNVLLLSKASVLCARLRIACIAIGPLAGNPFPDATPEFRSAMARALSIGLAWDLRIEAPFAAMHKEDVIRLGHSLRVPFELTLSCMDPTNGLHCGRCSKCRERRDGFAAAGIDDPAVYAAPSPRRGE